MTLGICAAAALAARIYLKTSPVVFQIAVFGAGMVLAAGVWVLPRVAGGRLPAIPILSTLLFLELGLPASAFWPGGITASRFGLTVIGACPIPVFDITISAGGVVGLRNKIHRVSVPEVLSLMSEDAETIIIACGWNGEVVVDEAVREIPDVRIVALKTGEAFDLYNRLRREGIRVALLAHTTC